jgi:two-component system LytT family response regulator
MKALVIDDERLARQELIGLLAAYPEIEIIGEAQNVGEALRLIDSTSPDLLFLDIQMPEKNGFDLLKELDRCPKVIFVTAYDEYALKAFEVSALDYLLKPVDPERLREAIQKVISEEQKDELQQSGLVSSAKNKLNSNDTIFIKDGEKCWFIELSKVRMFESEGNYVKVHFEDQHPLILRSLNSLEERLNEYTFFRANRKFIVNLKWISSIENWFNGGLKVELTKGEFIEISRRQTIRFKELMSL